MLKLSYLFCGILKRYNGTECKLSFKISLKLKSCTYKLSNMRLFLILCSYAKILTSSKEIVQVGLQARCFPTSVILVPLVFICSSNRAFIHRPVSPVHLTTSTFDFIYNSSLKMFRLKVFKFKLIIQSHKATRKKLSLPSRT